MHQLYVLSSYPPQGTTHAEPTVGVASYTKLLLTELKKQHPDLEITVFAEIFDTPTSYNEDGITINRTWKRGHIPSIITTCRQIAKDKPQQLLTSFEISMFGTNKETLLALYCLLLLKMAGIRITLVMHQVLNDFAALEKNAVKARSLNTAKKMLYLLMRASSTQCVVFEETLKTYFGGKKVHVIPHFVLEAKHIDKEKARETLGWDKKQQYILFFGFLAPYKGIDKLLDIWPDHNTNPLQNCHSELDSESPEILNQVQDDNATSFATSSTTSASQSTLNIAISQSPHISLIVAGGPNPNHKKNKTMQKYLEMLNKKASSKNLPITGFVPEEQIPLYFSACDAVILPYRTFLSSSGPLAHAIAYEKPFLLSTHLRPYTQTQDIRQAFDHANITIDAISFSYTQESLQQALSYTLTHIAQLTTLSRIIKEGRSIEKVAGEFYKVLDRK